MQAATFVSVYTHRHTCGRTIVCSKLKSVMLCSFAGIT